MSGETEAEVSGWTVNTLHSHVRQLLEERDHRYQVRYDLVKDGVSALMTEADKRYEQRFIAQQEAIQAALLAQKEVVQAALIAADRAVAKAEMASEKRFEGVNEFRATLSDQAANLMPRAEAEARIQAMSDKLGEVADRVNRSEGQGQGVAISWAVLVAVIGIGLTIVGVMVIR